MTICMVVERKQKKDTSGMQKSMPTCSAHLSTSLFLYNTNKKKDFSVSVSLPLPPAPELYSVKK